MVRINDKTASTKTKILWLCKLMERNGHSISEVQLCLLRGSLWLKNRHWILNDCSDDRIPLSGDRQEVGWRESSQVTSTRGWLVTLPRNLSPGISYGTRNKTLLSGLLPFDHTVIHSGAWWEPTFQAWSVEEWTLALNQCKGTDVSFVEVWEGSVSTCLYLT